MEKTNKIQSRVNKNIKVGDKVKIIDGSYLTVKGDNTQNPIIPFPLPEVTGTNEELNKIVGEVVESGITNYCTNPFLEKVTIQDIVVKLGNGLFRTSSKEVVLIEGEHKETFRAGDRFECSFGEFILCQVYPLEYCLVNLEKGNRLQSPIKVNDHNISMSELLLMSKNYILTKIN